VAGGGGDSAGSSPACEGRPRTTPPWRPPPPRRHRPSSSSCRGNRSPGVLWIARGRRANRRDWDGRGRDGGWLLASDARTRAVGEGDASGQVRSGPVRWLMKDSLNFLCMCSTPSIFKWLWSLIFQLILIICFIKIFKIIINK
jgi:hypothetical protein